MSAYLKFFELEQSPFESTDQSKVVLGTKALREAFSSIQTGLDEGASRVFLNGGPGVGKTSFARALPKLLGDETRVAGIADPSMPWESMRGGIAMQWGLDERGLSRTSLLEAAEDHRLLLVIDQAERATEDFLDHLDVLLSYRDEFADPVVQSVLLGQLSGNGAESAPPLMWWLDRIQTLQLEYAPLPREGVGPYIRKHLKRAGWRGGRLFTDDAALAIHGWTGGIPAEVSALCERLLVEAADSGIDRIDAQFVDLYNEDLEEAEGNEEPWNFDNQFDEFESAYAEAPQTRNGVDLNNEALSAAEAELSPAPEAASQIGPDAGLDFGFDAEADAEADREAETQAKHWRGEGTGDEAARSRHEEEQRIASQKAALPTQPGRARREEPLPRLETTLEHFETLLLQDDTEADSAEGWNATGSQEDSGVAEANYLDDEEGFDPGSEIDNETYAELEALEQALSAPPSAAELREIRGSFLAQHAKPLTLGALAAAIGGLAFAFLFKAPAADEASVEKTPKPSMLGRINGPADSMPTQPEPVVRLQNNAAPAALLAAPIDSSRNASPAGDDLLARVGPRLQRAEEAASARLANARSGKTRTQEQVEAENREEVFEDLRPQGLNEGEVDLSENRNR